MITFAATAGAPVTIAILLQAARWIVNLPESATACASGGTAVVPEATDCCVELTARLAAAEERLASLTRRVAEHERWWSDFDPRISSVLATSGLDASRFEAFERRLDTLLFYLQVSLACIAAWCFASCLLTCCRINGVLASIENAESARARRRGGGIYRSAGHGP